MNNEQNYNATPETEEVRTAEQCNTCDNSLEQNGSVYSAQPNAYGSFGEQRINASQDYGTPYRKYTITRTDSSERSVDRKSSVGKRSGGRGSLWNVAMGVLVCLIIAAAAGAIIHGINKNKESESTGVELFVGTAPVTETEVTNNGEPLTYAQIAKQTGRAVVGITVYADTYGWGSIKYSQGSGFIISKDGYVVTNSHVIGDDDHSDYSITVTIVGENGEREERKAVVVGNDKRTDLAVLKIDPEGVDLCVSVLGDSKLLVQGDEVVAIGNPGGAVFAGSVTNGIVSGIDRVIETSDGTSDNAMTYLQTNAAINPGNSGGPLLNMYGQVIGINSSKIVASGYEGLGFAIPMDKAKPIIEELIQKGSVERPVLGVKLDVVSELMAMRYDVPQGLIIQSISSGSKLIDAGVEKNDIITACDGEETKSLASLQNIIEKKNIGDTVTLTVFRLGNKDTFDVEVELISDAESVSVTSENDLNSFFNIP